MVYRESQSNEQNVLKEKSLSDYGYMDVDRIVDGVLGSFLENLKVYESFKEARV